MQQATAFAAGTAPALPASFDVTVSPREPLQAAIDRCREGGSVLLRPGAHEGGVVLSKEVHLFGRGEATLRRAAGVGPVVTSTAPAATLDGLVVRQGPCAEGEKGHNGIMITAGSLLVRHCDVSSKSWSSIYVEGASANPTILGCRLHGGTEAGIFFDEGSEGRVEGCDIAGGGFGIIIFDAEPVIIANKIHAVTESGVNIEGVGRRARLEGNRIWASEIDGVQIDCGAEPFLIANEIHGNKRSGVYVNGGGKGRLERNIIRSNGGGGIWVQELGGPSLTDNTIRDHAGENGFGVFVCDKTPGNIIWGEGNRFSGNEVADLAWEEEEEAAPAGSQPAAAPQPPAPSGADLKLLEKLECVVCKDVTVRPFSVCHEGHASACMPCYKLLKACPVCRGKLQSPPTRLRHLEDLAKDVLVTCPHAADGCPLDALRYADAGAHADVCDWRKVN